MGTPEKRWRECDDDDDDDDAYGETSLRVLPMRGNPDRLFFSDPLFPLSALFLGSIDLFKFSIAFLFAFQSHSSFCC